MPNCLHDFPLRIKNVVVYNMSLSSKKISYKQNTVLNMPILLIFSTAVFSSLAVTHGDTTLGSELIQHRIIPITRYLLVALVLFCTTWRFPSRNIGMKLIWILIWLSFSYIYIYDYNNSTFGIAAVCNIIFLCSIFFCAPSNLVKAVSLFRYYMIITALLGIIAFADFVTGGHLPHEYADYYTEQEGYLYINYIFSYLVVQLDGIRLCGLFNEPGYFGTFIAFFLIIDKIRLKKISNIILLIAGILSFSMAFFVLLGVGGIYYLIKNKYYYVVVAFVLLVIAFIPILLNTNFENQAVERLKTRVEYIFNHDSKTEAVNELRRDRIFNDIETRFESSDNKLFGYGSGYCKAKGAYDTSSYKLSIIEWGYVGFCMVYLLIILIAVLETRRTIEVLFFIICFSISIVQRPQIFTPAYFLLLFGSVHYITGKAKEEQCNGVVPKDISN